MKNKKPIVKNIWWKTPENTIDEARCYIKLYPDIISGYFLCQRLGISERSACSILKEERSSKEGDSIVINQKAFTYIWKKRNLCWSMDTMETRFIGGKIYLMLMLEEYSRLILGYKLCHKPLGIHPEELLLDTIERMETRPLLLKSDRGSEFINHNLQEFLAKNEILLLPSPCHYPQFNGRTEWGNRWMRKFTRPLERTPATRLEEIEHSIIRGIYLINEVVPRRIFDGRTSLEVYNRAEDPTDLERNILLQEVGFYNRDPEWFLDSKSLDIEQERI